MSKFRIKFYMNWYFNSIQSLKYLIYPDLQTLYLNLAWTTLETCPASLTDSFDVLVSF